MLLLSCFGTINIQSMYYSVPIFQYVNFLCHEHADNFCNKTNDLEATKESNNEMCICFLRRKSKTHLLLDNTEKRFLEEKQNPFIT